MERKKKRKYKINWKKAMNLIYFAKPFKTIKKSIDQVLNNDFFL